MRKGGIEGAIAGGLVEGGKDLGKEREGKIKEGCGGLDS